MLLLLEIVIVIAIIALPEKKKRPVKSLVLFHLRKETGAKHSLKTV